jgi:hypothetical protein
VAPTSNPERGGTQDGVTDWINPLTHHGPIQLDESGGMDEHANVRICETNGAHVRTFQVVIIDHGRLLSELKWTGTNSNPREIAIDIPTPSCHGRISHVVAISATLIDDSTDGAIR